MFCKNCGADIGNVKFCPNCGANQETVETNNTEINYLKINDNRKSMSIIIVPFLSVLGIAFLFIKGFFKYWSKSTFGGYGTPFTATDSYFELGNSVTWTIIAILMFLLPAVFTLVNLKENRKALSWGSFGCECTGLVYMLISSLIISEKYHEYNSGYTSAGYKYTFECRFLNFEFVFYIILAIFLIMAVFTIFDAMGKALIYIPKKRIESASKEETTV